MQTPTFIIMPSKAFKRVSLVYDLLTPDLFVSENGQTCFSEQQLKKVRLTGSLLVIQLSAPAVENAALPISLAEKIFATSEAVINKLTATPLSNYDFGEFTFGVLPEDWQQGETEPDEPADTKPGEILRQTDAVRGFLFHAALKGSAGKFSSQLTGSSINPLEALADVYFSRYGNTDLLCDLISLCIKYDKEAGWNAADIITELSQLHPESGNYIASAFASLESGVTDTPDFSDDEYLVEKAFLLLLLNPDENALRAIKQDTTLETGTLVTELAQKLAIFRYGYSRLDHQDRLRPGPDAVNSLRDIAAEVYNRLSGFVPASLPQHVEEKPESNDLQMSLGITGEPLIQFFTAETSDEHKYYKVRDLNLKKGFSGELVLSKTNSAYLVLINDIVGEGNKKFSPSLAKAAISNQHRLPCGSRFEVIDNSFVLKFTYSADAKPDEILSILSADIFPVTNALNLHLKKCKYYMEV